MSICIRNGSSGAASLFSIQGVNMPFDLSFLFNLISRPQDFPLFSISIYALSDDCIIENLLKKLLGDTIKCTTHFIIKCFINEKLDTFINCIQNAYELNENPEEGDLLKHSLKIMKRMPRVICSNSVLLGKLKDVRVCNKTVVNSITKYLKERNHRFLYIPIRLSGFGENGHANFVLMDNITGKIYYFEPHVRNDWSLEIIRELTNLFGPLLNYGWEIKSICELLIPSDAIQQKDILCQTWVLLFSCLYVLNIDNIDQSIITASEYSSALMDVFMCYIGQFESEIREWKRAHAINNDSRPAEQMDKIIKFKHYLTQGNKRAHLYNFLNQYCECFDPYDKIDFLDVNLSYRIAMMAVLIAKWKLLELHIRCDGSDELVLRKIYKDISDLLKNEINALTSGEIHRLNNVANNIRRSM